MLAITKSQNNRLYTDDALIHSLHCTIRIFAKTLNNSISDFDIYSSEWSILKIVKEHEAISQSEIAAFLDIEPAAISKTLSRLEKKGIIYRQRLNNNKEKNIFLTEQAKTQYADLAAVVEKHRNAALQSLSIEERTTLHNLIKKIYADIEKNNA